MTLLCARHKIEHKVLLAVLQSWQIGAVLTAGIIQDRCGEKETLLKGYALDLPVDLLFNPELWP